MSAAGSGVSRSLCMPTRLPILPNVLLLPTLVLCVVQDFVTNVLIIPKSLETVLCVQHLRVVPLPM